MGKIGPVGLLTNHMGNLGRQPLLMFGDVIHINLSLMGTKPDIPWMNSWTYRGLTTSCL
jgi:hypothetical protein